MNKPLAPGMVVVVVHVRDPRYICFVGMVGTIIRALSPLEQMISHDEWAVDLPDTKTMPCPDCGAMHGDTQWPFASVELRPLEDPDKEQAEDRIEEAVDELVNSVGGW